MDEKRGIGKNNQIPWHISGDFKRFKRITSGHPIIMGRKTWDSLPFKPLQNRTNIIVSGDLTFRPHQNHHKLRNCSNCEGLECAVAYTLDEALRFAKEHFVRHSGEVDASTDSKIRVLRDSGQARMTVDSSEEEVFVIGGGQIFQQALPLADKLYLTIVEGDYQCDTFFPEYHQFKKVVKEESKESEGYKYKFLELETS